MKRATIGLLSGLSLLALAAAPALAITIDGTLDVDYGAAKATQGVQTNFGDSNLGQLDFANGSELDEVYCVIQGDKLLLFFTGNLESNFNKLEIFIDVDGCPNGQATLRNDNPDVDFNGLNRMAGLIFEEGCCPDYYLTVGGGDIGGGDYALFANYAELLSGGGGVGRFLGQGDAGTDGTLSGGDNPDGIKVTLDNSNTLGVVGGCDADNGSGVRTGIEWEIPLSAIGNPEGCINLVAFVNGSGHDFLSNQVLGSATPPQCNLGEPSLVDFNQVGGQQKFQCCPSPVPAEESSWGRMKDLYR